MKNGKKKLMFREKAKGGFHLSTSGTRDQSDPNVDLGGS